MQKKKSKQKGHEGLKKTVPTYFHPEQSELNNINIISEMQVKLECLEPTVKENWPNWRQQQKYYLKKLKCLNQSWSC